MSHVADCAVSLGFLLTFARNVPNGYTTADVVQKIVIPATRKGACRYVELPSVPKAAVGPVRCFISHRWAADFTRELVSLVATHFADSADAARAETPPVSDGPCPPAVMRNAGVVGEGAGLPTADATSPSGIQASISNASTPQESRLPGGLLYPQISPEPRDSREGQAPPQELTQLQPPQLLSPLLPHQHQQQLLPTSIYDRSLSSGGGRSSRRSSLGAARPSATAAMAAAQQPKCCTSPPPNRPPYLGSSGTGTAVNGGAVAPALSSSTSAASCLLGLSGPMVSRSSSSRLRAGKEPPGSAAGGGGDVSVSGGAVPVLLGRPSSANSSGGGGGLAAPLPLASPFTSSHFAAADSATLLPGAPTGGDADDAESLRPFAGGGGGSFSVSLNPLHARPSAVTHQWPHQQFSSVCSRYSACSVSTAGGGGGAGASFSRQDAAAGATEPGASGGRRDVPPLPPQAPQAAAEPVASGAAVRSRSTVTGVLSYSGSRGPSRIGSAREPAGGGGSGRRASSASGCRQGQPNGGGAAAIATVTAVAAAGVASRASEASDAAAGDPTAAASSSSSSNSGSSSSGGGGSGGDGSGAGSAAAGVVTNAAVVDGLLRRFEGREEVLDVRVWLDVFAINQHPGAREEQQAQDLSQLHEVVGRCQETLLVLDRGGLVLTRIWCLYEIWHTVRRKGPEGLRVLAGPLEFGELAHVWGELDVERAQATVPSDRDRILADIRATTGAPELNRAIQQALVKSASLDLDSAREAAPRTPHHGERAFRAAFLLRTAGSGGAALAAAREAADVFCGCRGPAHPDTLRALRTVAGCHKDLGAATQAAGLMEQQVVPYLEEAYGSVSTESGALDELGMLYYTLGQHDKAYDALLTALCRRLRQLELTAPPSCAVATSHLTAALAASPCVAALEAAAAAAAMGRAGGGAVAAAAGRVLPPLEPLSGEQLTAVLTAVRQLLSELEEAARRAEESAAAAAPLTQGGGSNGGAGVGSAGSGGVVVLRGDVGSSVELVGMSLHCLGLVQRERAQRCRSSESGSLLREARELMEASVALLQLSSTEARGLAASDARSNLAALAMEGYGELAAAEALLRTNLAATEAVYGPHHPHTATAANNLALCLKRQRHSHPDKAAEAVSLYRRCLDSCGRGLGESHPETLVVATNLGVMLADQRQYSESERLLTRAVAALPPQLGDNHPDVLAAHRRLAEVLEARNKLFEAEAMFRVTLQLAEGAPPETRDHGVVLEAREGLERVQALLEAAVREAWGEQGSPACCAVS